LQQFINEGSTILTNLQRLRSDNFIKFVVKNYEEAASALSQALEDSRQIFEKKKSRDCAHESKLKLADEMFDTSLLANQEIEVKTDYAARNENRNEKRILDFLGRKVEGGWFYASWAHISHKEGYLSGDNGWDYADANREHQKQAYKTARETNIKNLRDAHINKVAAEKKNEHYYCEIDLYSGLVSFSKHLPVCIYPYSYPPKTPILPMPVSALTKRLIPDIYYQAQMMGLGTIMLAYEIVDKQFVLNANFFANEENNKYREISSLTIPFDQRFFDESEAILNVWYGEKYCDDLGNVDIVSYPAEMGNNWHTLRTVQVPRNSEHVGLYQCMDQHVTRVKFLDSKEERAFWQEKINEVITGLRKEWYTDLRRTMAQDSFSTFGNAVATFDACAKILSLVSEIVLADKKDSDMFTCLIQKHQNLAFDQRGLDNILKSCPVDNIAKQVASKFDTAIFLENALKFLQTNRCNPVFPFFDGTRVLADLLECMDRYVEKMTIGPSITQIAAKQKEFLRAAAEALMQNAQSLRALSDKTSDPAIKSELDELARKNEENYTNMGKRIATDVRLLGAASNLTGYDRNGLLRSRVTVAEVKELPVRDPTSAAVKWSMR